MRKSIKSVLSVFTILFFTFLSINVFAVTKENAANRCVYSFVDKNLPKDEQQNSVFIFTQKDDYDWNHFSYEDLEIKGGGNGNHDITPNGEEKSIQSGVIKIYGGKMYCPSYVYFCPTSDSLHWDGYLVNNKNSCNYKALKIDIDESLTRGAGRFYPASEDSSGKIKDCKTSGPRIDSNNQAKFDAFLSNKQYKEAYNLIQGFLNGLNDYCDSEAVEKYAIEVSKLKDQVSVAIAKDTELTEEQINDLVQTNNEINNLIGDINTTYSIASISIPFNNIPLGCNELISQDLKDVIQLVLKWIRIIAPIALIILVAVDFAQVVISNDKDAMQKAISKAIKRGIAALALFFIPLFVSIMINWLPAGSQYYDNQKMNCDDIFK